MINVDIVTIIHDTVQPASHESYDMDKTNWKYSAE